LRSDDLKCAANPGFLHKQLKQGFRFFHCFEVEIMFEVVLIGVLTTYFGLLLASYSLKTLRRTSGQESL
jgi:hypothetical protein